MPFLEDLIKRSGKRGGRLDDKVGEDRRRRSEDRSLTGEEDTFTRQGTGDAAPRRKGGLLDEGATGERSRACGNAACGFGFTMPWKSREHPIFEGRWACSRRCLTAMVRTALAQEAEDAIGDDGPQQHQHRIPLGLIMLAQGWITHPQLQRALEAQRSHGSGRIGDWLVSECGMKPERIARGLSVQWNCPVLSTESFWPEAMALALPRVLLEEYGVVPLRLAGRTTLFVGFQDGLDASASFAIEQMTGLKTESGLLPEAEFGRARKILLGCEFPEQSLATVSDRDGLVRAITETVEHEQPVASRLVRLHRHYWLRIWAKNQGGRAAGDLPENVAGARDYLYTIGSRAASRSTQLERSYEQVAMPERIEAVEHPIAKEMEAETILGEEKVQESELVLPQSAIESPESTSPGVDGDVPIENGVSSEATALEQLAISATVVDGAVVEGTTVECAVVEVPVIKTAAEEDLIELMESVAGLESVSIAAASPTPHSLAIQEPWIHESPLPKYRFAEGERTNEPSARAQIVRPDELENLQRFMRRSYETEIEPIDGEYLFELTSVESSVIVSVPDRSSGWGRLGQLLKPRLSFQSREIDPVSGPDQGV